MNIDTSMAILVIQWDVNETTVLYLLNI